MFPLFDCHESHWYDYQYGHIQCGSVLSSLEHITRGGMVESYSNFMFNFFHELPNCPPKRLSGQSEWTNQSLKMTRAKESLVCQTLRDLPGPEGLLPGQDII